MDILVYHRNLGNAKVIAKALTKALIAFKSTDANLFWMSPGDTKLHQLKKWNAKVEEWKKFETTSFPSFDLILRHGSDRIDYSLFFPIKTKIVFGGARKYPLKDSENLLLKSIFNLKESDWWEIFNYATSEGGLIPELISDDDLEKKIQNHYQHLELKLDNSENNQPTLVILNPGSTISSNPGEFDIIALDKKNSYDLLIEEIIKKITDQQVKTILLPAEMSLSSQRTSQELDDLPETNFQSLQGTALVRDLRLMDIACPILIYSFFPQDKLRERDQYQIFDVPGQYYLKIDSKGKKSLPKDLDPLSEHMLDDIKYYHFTAEGKIHEIFHDIGSQLQSGEEVEKVIAKGFKALSTFFVDQYIEHEKILERIQTLWVAELMAIKDHYERRVAFEAKQSEVKTLLLQSELQEGEESQPMDWQILYLEDNPIHQGKILEALKRLGFKEEQCEAVSSGTEALEKMRKDQKGKGLIKVFISDWRLMETDGKTWQQFQGLDIIEKIAKDNVDIAFFVLTDKTGAILNQAKKRQQFSIRWYSKKEAFKDQQSLYNFCLHVKKEGDALQSIDNFNNSPKGAYWWKPWLGNFNYPLREYYSFLKQLPVKELDFIKKGMFLQAEMIIENFKFNNHEKVDDEYKLEYQRKLLAPSPKEVVENYHKNSKELESFLNKLIGRLVYFMLRKQQIPKEEIADALGTKALPSLLNHFAISEKGYRLEQNMLPYEKEWILGDYTAHEFSLKSLLELISPYIYQIKEATSFKKLAANKKNEAHSVDDPLGEIIDTIKKSEILSSNPIIKGYRNIILKELRTNYDHFSQDLRNQIDDLIEMLE